MKKRSPTICPIVFSLDIFGDTWSLVVLRDILIFGHSHFREFLAGKEKIASNILSNRLELLVEHDLITKRVDPKNKSAAIYAPTQKALDLLPMIIEMMRWGITHNPNSDTNNKIMSRAMADPEGLRQHIVAKFAAKS